ncbi:hypothetical protein Sjap_010728 [Stephania japonica]|uniref:Uncharacterized protein n=1 Tax=Stephania japonica TaxID=461633 RepID=A0AAP0P7E7_9MAGN
MEKSENVDYNEFGFDPHMDFSLALQLSDHLETPAADRGNPFSCAHPDRISVLEFVPSRIWKQSEGQVRGPAPFSSLCQLCAFSVFFENHSVFALVFKILIVTSFLH